MHEMIVYWIIGLLFLALLAFAIGKWIKHKPLYPFMPYKYDFRKRRDTFREVLRLLSLNEAKILIETGTSREGLRGAKSNGAATIVFGRWAKENNALLHSVDISSDSIKVSQQEVKKQGLQGAVQLHLMDSLEFLEGFNERVDFLYLDSYDYSLDPETQQKSQEHHLQEFKNIEGKLHHNTIVLIDDCGLPGGGKGKIAIEYMLKKGWFIHVNAYQVLLLHKDNTLLG